MHVLPLSMVTWSASQYTRFEAERTRPARDLLTALPDIEARAAVDLGCGPGNSTALLAARFPAAQVRGIDPAPDMLAAARARLPALRFDLMDVAAWLAEPGSDARRVDVILANAVLQWLPDHERLLPALAARLAPGGCLAVQMPDNLEEPAHRVMRAVAADGPWAGALAGVAAMRAALPTAERYHDLMREAGCGVAVWRTTYYHVIPGGIEGVVDWFKGSGLRPFLDPLVPAARSEFLTRYAAALGPYHPPRSDGSVLLPFPRLFIVAVGG